MDIHISLGKGNILNDVAAECNLLGRRLELAGDKEGTANAMKELAQFIKSPSDNETKPVVARAMNEGIDLVKEACQRYIIFGRDVDDNRLEAFMEPVNANFSHPISDAIDVGSYNVSSPDYISPDGNWLCIKIGSVSLNKGCAYVFTFNFHDANFSGGSQTAKFAFYVGQDKIDEFPAHGTPAGRCEFTASENGEADVLLAFIGENPLDIGPDEMPDSVSTGNFTLSVTGRNFGSVEICLRIENFNPAVTSSVKSYAHRLIVDTIMAAILKDQIQDGYAKYLTTAQAARDGLIRALQARNSFGRTAHDWN